MVQFSREFQIDHWLRIDPVLDFRFDGAATQEGREFAGWWACVVGKELCGLFDWRSAGTSRNSPSRIAGERTPIRYSVRRTPQDIGELSALCVRRGIRGILRLLRDIGDGLSWERWANGRWVTHSSQTSTDGLACRRDAPPLSESDRSKRPAPISQLVGAPAPLPRRLVGPPQWPRDSRCRGPPKGRAPLGATTSGCDKRLLVCCAILNRPSANPLRPAATFPTRVVRWYR